MEGVWDKLDGYTKSDHLELSSDGAEEDQGITRRAKLPSTSSENSLPTEVDGESSSEGHVELEGGGSVHEDLLNEMRQSVLHTSNEPRNVQEKVDEISAEKRQQKEELSEMHHKAQVISKSARMSAADVLSSIINSETINSEENSQMEEYYSKIRSIHTESNSTEVAVEKHVERTSSSSDLDLPDIPPPSTTVLNVGVMKSRANVARQGSMKARRKPTLAKRKSWTAGITGLSLQEQDETEDNVDKTGESNNWALSQPKTEGDIMGEPLCGSGSFTPSDSSSDEEREAIKPHLRSGVALPGLGDALKIQMQRSELKQRPTALHLVKTAKDAKDNAITKEDKAEVVPSKPQWMKEVEQRKKTPRSARRKHMTLPGRCSELDKLFEKRRNLTETEGVSTDVDQTNQDEDDNIAREAPKPKTSHNKSIDSELDKLFEKRRNLTEMEGVSTDVDQTNQDEDDTVAREAPKPKTSHNKGIDPELSKLFERRKNMSAIEGFTTDKEQQSFRPRTLHLEDDKASELDKIFEKRKKVRPVEGITTEGEKIRVEEPLAVVRPTNVPAEHRQASGIVRARFHDGHRQLEPLTLSTSGQVKVATVSEVIAERTRREEVFKGQTTAGQGQATTGAQVAQFVFDGRGGNRATVNRIPVVGARRSSGYQSEQNIAGQEDASTSQTTADQGRSGQVTTGAQVAQFVFDGKGGSRATVGRIPVAGSRSLSGHPEQNISGQEDTADQSHSKQATTGAQVAQFVFDGKGGSRATVGHIPTAGGRRPSDHPEQNISGKEDPHEGRPAQATTGAQVAQFVFDGKGGDRATVGRIPTAGNQRPSPRHPEHNIVNQNASPVSSRYDSQPRDDHVTQQARPSQDVNTYDSPTTRALSSQSAVSPEGSATNMVHPSREPRSTQGTPTVPVFSPKSSKSDARSFIEQLSVKPVSGYSQEKSEGKSKYRVRARDNSAEHFSRVSVVTAEPERPRLPKATENNHYKVTNKSHCSNLPRSLAEGNRPKPLSHSTSYATSNSTSNSTSHSSSHSPRPPESSRNLPPLNLNRSAPPSNVHIISPISKSPEKHYPPQRHNEKVTRTPKESYDVLPQPDRLRMVTSPVEAPSSLHNHNPNSFATSENERLVNRGFENRPSRVKSPENERLRNRVSENEPRRAKSPENERLRNRVSGNEPRRVKNPGNEQLGDRISENGPRRAKSPENERLRNRVSENEPRSMKSLGAERLGNRTFENGPSGGKSPVGSYSNTGQVLERQRVKSKPVTVTVKSISENHARAQLGASEPTGTRGGMLPRVVNGDVPRRNEKMDSAIKRRPDPQSSESPALAPVIPKWKQELREKKRLQKERQGEMSRQKDNTKADQSQVDLAEWQKRLKGIRKTWGENEDADKDSNDNINEESQLDQGGDDGKEVPGFLKEFKTKNSKQKVKVTVTAKSTPGHQDSERSNLDEDLESSSKHELGTYV